MDIKVLKNYLIAPLFDLIAPPSCIVCGKPFPSDFICSNCLAKIEKYRIKPPFCRRCGTPLSGSKCRKCHGKKLYFDKNRGAYVYKGPVVTIIERFKYSMFTKLAVWMAFQMAKAIEDEFDIIVPVPLYSARIRERGFSQTCMLADKLSRITEKPWIKALKRTRYTKSQTLLKANERVSNVRNAFEIVKPEAVKDKRILLVDDVMTTGATLNECARVLKKNGTREVFGLVFAIAL